jgi:DNA-binding winged helix-turn-helix (wHTH) protein/predicted ATPase
VLKVAPDRPISFGRHVFVPSSGQLRRGAREIRLTPKAAAVLAALTTRPGALVTKRDLFATVWPGVAVSDAALTSCIQELRGALGDDARRPRYIETIHRRGYRFIAPVSSAAAGLPPAVPPAHVVGREHALATLGSWLADARDGTRQIVLVSGEPGIGKTTVVETCLAAAVEEGFVVGPGRCIEHYGAGEAYLPLLEALTRLGAAPDSALVPVLRRHAPTWLAQLPSLVGPAELRTLQRTTAGATRERMLRELAEAIEALATDTPIALWLEDLHWSDTSTLEWLAYVGRRPGAARLLVLGTYRPAEVIRGRHPLSAVRDELVLHGRCRELALELLDEAAVARYLVTRFEPDGQARELSQLARLIHRRTEGNPLFMTSVVHDLIARGVLVARAGGWAMTEPPDAVEVTIPDDVRGLIALQFGRLEDGERRVLEVASVAGLEFSAALVAAGADAGTAAVEAACATLARRGSFLVARGTAAWPDGTVAGRYAFGHWLHQQVVYDHVAAGRRVELHRRIAGRLAAAYGDRSDEVATELATHFEHGGDAQRAVHSLQRTAAIASRRGAPRAAQAHLARALALLPALPEGEERLRQEVSLQMAMGASLMATGGWGTPEVERSYARAEALCQQLGDTPQLFPAVWGVWLFRWGRSELATAEALGERLGALAERAGEPGLVLQAQHALWATRLVRGLPLKALEHARHGIALYEPDAHAGLAALYGNHDPGVCARVMAAWTLELLGEPEEAVRTLGSAIELARRLQHPFTEALAYVFAAHLQRFRGDPEAAMAHAARAMTLAREQGFALLLAWAATMHGWSLAHTGREPEGVVEMRQAIASARTSGSSQLQTFLLGTLADGLVRAGEAGAALDTITEALSLAARTGERFYEAELHRLEGELRRTTDTTGAVGPERTPAECFQAALAIARRQGARALERRAAASLAT